MEADTYNRIVKSAERLFNRFGVRKTAVSEIAEEANVSRATLFNNFGSKNGIIDAVLQSKIVSYKQKAADIALRSVKPAVGLKILITERLRLLNSMPFISDVMIKGKGGIFDEFSNEMNETINCYADKLMEQDYRGTEEKARIKDSLMYLVKGMEHSLLDAFEQFSLIRIEKDLDYLLDSLFPSKAGEEF